MLIHRYRFFLVSVVCLLLLYIFQYSTGTSALTISASTLREMILILPPVFILLGLLDVWVPRETMVKLMGDHAGIKGILLAFLLGSATAGPLYGAFPVAAVLLKKGVSFTNILIFIGAWSTTKIPMLFFELSSLGLRFTLSRLLIDIPGILIIAFLIAKVFVTPKEIAHAKEMILQQEAKQ